MKAQHEITSTTQVRRKETILLVRSVLCVSNTQGMLLMDAVATQTINITLVVCRPAGTALNPEPRGRHHRPFRVGLPPAVKHSMRGNADSSWGSKTRRHLFYLLVPLLPFFLWVAELCHLQHQREKLVNMPTNTTKRK